MKATSVTSQLKTEKDRVKKEIDDKTEKIQKLEKTLEDLEKKLNLEKDVLLEVSAWTHNFKTFYSELINRSLHILQGQANLFLDKVGTNLQLQLEGYRVLADGTIREKITANLLRDGIVEGGIKSGSKGERARLECSVIVASQEIINSSTETGGLDFLFVDEVLDSLDGVGMQSLINLS